MPEFSLFPKVFVLVVGCAGFASDVPAEAPDKPAARSGQAQTRHERLNQLAGENQWKLVFVGDSITEGWLGVGKKVWQEFYGQREAGNLGISGDQTQHVLYRVANGNLEGQSPKLAIVMIGTNNLGNNQHGPEETIKGIQSVVESLRSKLPKTKILLLGVFPRGALATNAYRTKINEVNQAISALADWQAVHYLDIGHTFVESDGSLSKQIMPDALHLSTAGYRRWAEAIEFKVAELLGEESSSTTNLFDGSTLTGWTDEDGNSPPKGWGVVDGTLAVTGWGEDAFTAGQFADFDFQVEWRMPRKGNSGIFYRVFNYRYIWLGPEYQLADDLTRRYQPTAVNSTGANLDLYGPDAHKPVRPHGDWNHTRIVVVGDHVEHWLNGRRILQYDFQTDDWNNRVKDSKFSRLHPYFGQPPKGKFKLQNHVGSKVQYRDVLVRELNK